MLYIHYGSSSFDPCRFKEVRNVDECHRYYGYDCYDDYKWLWEHKHFSGGGFWASPVNAKVGWIDIYKEIGDADDLIGRGNFCFNITPAARVYHVRSGADLLALPHYDVGDDDYDDYDDYDYDDDEAVIISSRTLIDFEQMLADGWDAIEVHWSELEEEDSMGDDAWDVIYGLYDLAPCDAVFIMNPKIIAPVG